MQSFLPKKTDIIEDIQHRDPDILCYTETHLKKSTPLNLTSIPGYRQFREDRTTGRKKSGGGGGVSIHVKEELQVEKVTVPASSGSGSIVESLWIKVKLDKRKSVIVGCFYRPPTTGEQVHRDFNCIEEQVQHVIASFQSQRIVINGDLNADSKTNLAAYNRLVELEKYGLKCFVNEPTFFRRECSSVLDVILLSECFLAAYSPPTCSVESCDYVKEHRRVLFWLCRELDESRNIGKDETGVCLTLNRFWLIYLV